MIHRPHAVRFLLFLSIILISVASQAQPMLPDIAGTSQKGIVVLTWNCQYNGIKSIAVQRSSDSAHNYATIGYVKNTKKGVQAFIDGHPGVGNNYYQLYIIFGSDLTWNSNHLRIHLDSATLENERVVLPPNDSLQKFAIAGDGTIKSKSGIVVRIDTTNGKMMSTNDRIMESIKSGSDATKKPEISISVTTDPSGVNAYTYVKSRYVFTNPLTGHVNMEVPDVTMHHYSIKFFDTQGNQVLEVPKISVSPIIIDKRNFERKGIYKFILRQDNAEMETGYITIY